MFYKKIYIIMDQLGVLRNQIVCLTKQCERMNERITELEHLLSGMNNTKCQIMYLQDSKRSERTGLK